MTIRKIVFWMHLSCGVTAGLVIVMMSVTGVLLTYERQMMDWSIRSFYYEPSQDEKRLPLNELITAADGYAQQGSPSTLTVSSDQAAPVGFQLSRFRTVYVNPYTAEVQGEPKQGLLNFFNTVTGWHRWFDVEGKNRQTARMITGACNLMFLFLVCTGMYLWIPRRLKWPFIRGVLFFNPHAVNSKARDYNWHNVFGIWSAIPLLFIVATAVVFSYPWANNLVYQIVGEDPPVRGSRVGDMRPDSGRQEQRGSASGFRDRQGQQPGLPVPAAGFDVLFDRASKQVEDWRTITMQIPRDGTSPARFTIDQGTGGQPQKRHQLSLNQQTGDVVNWEPYSSLSPGRRLRVFIRYLHTGEALGIAGQTIAGAVSLTAVIMVWTGIALAYRRLIK